MNLTSSDFTDEDVTTDERIGPEALIQDAYRQGRRDALREASTVELSTELGNRMVEERARADAEEGTP